MGDMTSQTVCRLASSSYRTASALLVERCFVQQTRSSIRTLHKNHVPQTRVKGVRHPLFPEQQPPCFEETQIRHQSPAPQVRSITTRASGSIQEDEDLVRLQRLISQLAQTNSKIAKIEIIKSFPELRSLLLFIIDPHVRLHVRSTAVVKWLRGHAEEYENDQFGPPLKLFGLLQALDKRQYTGNQGLRLITSYLHRTGVIGQESRQHEHSEDTALFEAFLRCLDRNLKVGVSSKIIRAAFLEEQNGGGLDHIVQQDSVDLTIAGNVALGQQVTESELIRLLDRGEEAVSPSEMWYLSRKLDGIRCLLRVDVEANSAGGWRAGAIASFSRTGRSFETLKELELVARTQLENNPGLTSILQQARERGLCLHPSGSDRSARLYIDGEVCMADAERAFERGGAYGDGQSSQFTEDFQSIAGPIKRKNHTLQNIKFFPFDLLLYAELQNWRSASDSHEPFHVRIGRLDCLFFEKEVRDREGVIERLEQVPVRSVREVQVWQERALEHGWEGLMLRKGGAYEGKRSPSIRKLKQSKEAEYVVVDVELTTMRLPVGQIYTQRKALASAIIVHHGHRVNVGSGFSVEERVRYAEHPELLLGKQITVAYFGESHALSRPGGPSSLRFPRVKAVWEAGKRDI